MTCLGCNLANNIYKTYKIYETNTINVIMDINPFNYGHLLIMPKDHFESIDNLPKTILIEIMEVAQQMKKHIEKTYGCENIIIMQNNGPMNSLSHYHLHVIPHYDGEDLSTLYDADSRQANDEETLMNEYNKIISHL